MARTLTPIQVVSKAAATVRLLVFLVLALGLVTAFSINAALDNADSARNAAMAAERSRVALAQAARVVVHDGCVRDKRTRRALRTIITRGDRNLRGFYEAHTITAEQYRRALRLSADARRLLRDVNCKRAAAKLPL